MFGKKTITTYGFLKWILEISLCIQISHAIKLLFSPLSIYCGKEGRKEINIHSPHLRGGVLGSTSLTVAYLHKLFGILLGKVVYSP